MKVPILKIPFDEDDADFISGELRRMLLDGRLTMDGRCREFEEAFARFCGAPLALGCASGTAALEMICRAIKVAGGSVAVPANTFMATALAPLAAGGRIILVDVDPIYFQMDPEDLARKMRADTRAVILVHLGGFISPAWRRIKAIAENNGACLIEDAAHAHGAEFKAQRAGSLGTAGAFSFYPTKVLTCAEGGMITTADSELHDKLAAMRQHGQRKPGSNLHHEFGLNYRLSEIHALLGLAMMKKAGWILARRRRAAGIYDRLLADSHLTVVIPPPGQSPAYYKYMALLPEGLNRDRFKRLMKEEHQISLTGEVYSRPLHWQPFWAEHPEGLAAPSGPLPVSEMVAERQICLPIYPDISDEALEYVAEKILSTLKRELA
ncbi:MAG: DegT/DnrJ/EryC1/StrS family aminotransferase [Candidatus Adiutrix sp.]|jgi:dTDP-4-amino-4,6-dideoxygalactose transaminase|nr:DegT/DnrJ/EryC1/StrS family aminotransferase [Candidatus Adiutrix sp.]